jgi:hypothetical protein
MVGPSKEYMKLLHLFITLPLVSWFIMLLSIATAGEFVVVNKNGIEEWLAIMTLMFIIYVFMAVKNSMK